MSKSIFEILDKNKDKIVDENELKSQTKSQKKRIESIDPLVGLQLRFHNFNIAKGKRGLNKNEFEKQVIQKKKMRKKQTKLMKSKNNVELIKKANKKYLQSVNVFNTTFKGTT